TLSLHDALPIYRAAQVRLRSLLQRVPFPHRQRQRAAAAQGERVAHGHAGAFDAEGVVEAAAVAGIAVYDRRGLQPRIGEDCATGLAVPGGTVELEAGEQVGRIVDAPRR